jgi:hypothetical protein
MSNHMIGGPTYLVVSLPKVIKSMDAVNTVALCVHSVRGELTDTHGELL